jgi:Spy/CpxP family protein refolding chaperone
VNRQVASFLIASSLALGIPLAADAQPMPGQVHARQHQEQGASQRWLRRLNLTEAQRDQVFRIMHDSAPAMREQMKIVRGASQALREAALSGNFDRGRARQAADAQAKAMSELALMRAERMSQVVAILTPEQRQRLEQSRQRRERS